MILLQGRRLKQLPLGRSDFGTLGAGFQGRLQDRTRGHSVSRGQWWMGAEGSTGPCIGMEGVWPWGSAVLLAVS